MEVNGQLHTLAALPLKLRCVFNKKLGGPQSEHCGGEVNLLPVPGFKPQSVQLIAYSLD
jgi:hypothetical protein